MSKRAYLVVLVLVGWGSTRSVFALAGGDPGELWWGPAAMVIGAGMAGPAGGYGGANHGLHGYFGVDVHDVNDDDLVALKLKETRGAKIVRVDHDGPAAQAGLRERDVVLMMNGQAIEGEEQLRRMLHETPAGRSLTVVISRDGQTQTVTAQMGDREEVERQAWQRHLSVQDPVGGRDAVVDPGPRVPAGSRGMGFFHAGGNSTMSMGHGERGLLAGASGTGAMLEALSPQLAEFFGAPNGAGLLVRSVARNSPAEEGGLRAGDVVVKLNQAAVASGSDWTKVARESKGRPVSVTVLRDKHEQTLTITPDGKHRSRLEFPRCGPEGFAGMRLPGEGTVLAAVRSVALMDGMRMLLP